jgi:heterodisulfide reductase subunit A-like polyferredoxin
LIGQEAKAAWKVNAEATPPEEGEKGEKKEMDIENKTLIAGGGIAGLLLLLILL